MSKSQKKKNKKKAAAANKADGTDKVNGDHARSDAEDHDEDAEDEAEQAVCGPREPSIQPRVLMVSMQKPAAHSADPGADDVDDVDDDQPPLSPTLQTNGTPHHSISSAIALGLARSRSQQGISASPPPPSDASARLDAIAKERDALRQEVTELRQSLEEVQNNQSAGTSDETHANHEEEMRSLREELDEANEGKEHFETQYKNLLGRVNTIKTSLGDRLKADAVCLRKSLQQTDY